MEHTVSIRERGIEGRCVRMLLLIVSTDNTNLSSQRLAAGAAEKRCGQGWVVLPVLLPVLEAKSSQIDQAVIVCSKPIMHIKQHGKVK